MAEATGPGDERPSQEELLDFPCDYVFKAFGPSGPRFLEGVRTAVGQVVPVSLDALKTRPSSGASYQCVSVVVRLQNLEQLQRIYAALRAVAGLKYLL